MEKGKLTFTRKPHQTLHFRYIDQYGKHQEVDLAFTDIVGRQAKVVIHAPKSMSITRGEILTS